MIHAYDRLYLDKARTVLARMLDFAVYDLKYDITDFFDLFLASGIAGRFEKGDSSCLVGKSGVELAYEVLEASGQTIERFRPNYSVNRSREYWVGWALAYYQWETALSFAHIVKYIPIKKILELYNPYHEMDIRQFVDKMNEMFREAKSDTNLKILRKKAGFSQTELAELSGIPVRTIQQYEQRQKSINKAQVQGVIRLAKVLSCNPEDLMEYPEE